MTSQTYFTHEQGPRFAAADAARARWIDETEPVARHERAIHAGFVVEEGPVLELGAGEGLTTHFRPDVLARGYVGTDLHPDRVRYLVGAAAGARGVACDAAHLPFADGSFGTVLCRDLLHHIPPGLRPAVMGEVARVLHPRGSFTLIEPNAARSPLVAAFSALVPTERMALTFDADRLGALVESSFDDVTVGHVEPSMLYRVLLHYRFGAPALARVKAFAGALRAWEQLMARAPRRRWAYVRIVARRPRRSPVR